MNRADRWFSLGLFLLAALAWLAVAYVLLNLDPRNDSARLLAGALLLGGAVTLTLAPLLWLGAFFVAHQIAYRGAWWRALRRGLLVGLIVAAFVVLRGQAALAPALALFIVVMAVLVEVTLSLRR